jgi:hypothetical protein
MLKIFKRKHWINESVFDGLYAGADEINRMLSGLIGSLR